jgi:hypothetical protein
MKLLQSSCIVFVIASSGLLHAQQPTQPPYERVLVPIVFRTPIAGAFASQWKTELVVRNESDVPLVISPTPFAGSITTFAPFKPHSTFVYTFDPLNNPNGGKFLYIGSPGSGKVTFNFRAQDISRQASTWGTQVPVVSEKEVATGTMQLLNIPINTDFRNTLRVYDFDSATSTPTQVRVQIFDMCGFGPIDNSDSAPCSDTPLIDTTLLLPTGGEDSFVNPDHPGMGMIGDLLSTFPQLAGVAPRPGEPTGIPRVRVVIDPVTAGLRFWGFVSVTNNATQHVTLVTPN